MQGLTLERFVSGQLEECRLGRGSGAGGGGNFCERTPRDANVVKIEVDQVAAGVRERERSSIWVKVRITKIRLHYSPGFVYSEGIGTEMWCEVNTSLFLVAR